MPLNNLILRAITGIVFIGTLLGAIVLGEKVALLFFAFVSIVGLWEFFNLIKKGGYAPHSILGFILLLVTFASLWDGLIPLAFPKNLFLVLGVLFLGVFIGLLGELFRGRKNPFANLGVSMMGVYYIIVSVVSMFYMGFMNGNFGPNELILFFILIWTNDTFAYLVGRTIGKTKLFERISPKKTIEGSIGGLVFTMITGYVLSQYVITSSVGGVDWVIISFLIVVFGSLGDLVESMLKRSVGVKDSGKILPGHGGILDRFDAAFFAAPFILFYLLFFVS